MEFSYHSLGDASFPRWRIHGGVSFEVTQMLIAQLEELQDGKGDMDRLKSWYAGCTDLSMVERAVTGGDAFVVPDPFANLRSYFGTQGGDALPGAEQWQTMPSRKEAALRNIEHYRAQLAEFRAGAAVGTPPRTMLEIQLRQKGGLPRFEGNELIIPTDSLVMAPVKARSDECWQAKYGGLIRIDLANDVYIIEPDGEPDQMKVCGQKYAF